MSGVTLFLKLTVPSPASWLLHPNMSQVSCNIFPPKEYHFSFTHLDIYLALIKHMISFSSPSLDSFCVYQSYHYYLIKWLIGSFLNFTLLGQVLITSNLNCCNKINTDSHDSLMPLKYNFQCEYTSTKCPIHRRLGSSLYMRTSKVLKNLKSSSYLVKVS